ncbi:hypothetical protein mRhiFer1_009311 [Rhinolophus ferrumequinum]|uniref:Uncharacterized protein n=1 Tax=Rhinolophus ferrumequinum TaxID=59479 RepID=A0A7J7RXL9_RHIFE|nr:hypothetical protein mRhiFer1_009311 [Rhinolophus ferrumequinum]
MASDSAMTEARMGLHDAGSIWGSIRSHQECTGGGHCPRGRGRSVSRRNLQRLRSVKTGIPFRTQSTGLHESGGRWGIQNREAEDHSVQGAFSSLSHISLAIKIMDSGVRKPSLQISALTFV